MYRLPLRGHQELTLTFTIISFPIFQDCLIYLFRRFLTIQTFDNNSEYGFLFPALSNFVVVNHSLGHDAFKIISEYRFPFARLFNSVVVNDSLDHDALFQHIGSLS